MKYFYISVQLQKMSNVGTHFHIQELLRWCSGLRYVRKLQPVFHFFILCLFFPILAGHDLSNSWSIQYWLVHGKSYVWREDSLIHVQEYIQLAIMTVVNNKIDKLPIKFEVYTSHEWIYDTIILMIYSNDHVPTNLNQSSAISLFFYTSLYHCSSFAYPTGQLHFVTTSRKKL